MEHFNRLGDPSPQRIGVVRALRGLGDLLVLVPALRALRTALPGAEISLIGLPSSRAFVQRFSHYLDHLVEFPGFPGIPEAPFSASEFKNWLASSPAQRFDLVLQMHGNGQVINSFVELLGAPRMAGFYLPGFHCPDPQRFLPYPSAEPEVWRLLRLVEFLGIPLKADHLEFPLLPGDWLAFEQVKTELVGAGFPRAEYPDPGSPIAGELKPQEYAVLHPGAFDPARRWSPARFAEVADALAQRGLQIVVTGTQDEADDAAAVVSTAQTPIINLAGRTSLGALAVLLSQARLLVSNDTGVSHLASALRVPSVIVFMASDPLRWGPQDRRLHRVVRSVAPLVASSNANKGIGNNGANGSGSYFLPLTASGTRDCDRRCLRDACRCKTAETTLLVPTVDAVLSEAFALLGEVTHAG